MTDYAKTRRETAERMGGESRCLFCQAPMSTKTLSDFGARCFPCFKAYCREPFYQHQRSPHAERVRAEIAAMGRRVPA